MSGKKESVDNGQSTQNLIDGAFVEGTKQKIKIEMSEEPVGYDKSANEFLNTWKTEKIPKTETVKEDKLLREFPTDDFVKSGPTLKQKIKIEKIEEPVVDDDVIVVCVRRSVRIMQKNKIKVEKVEKPSENDKSTTNISEKVTMTPTIKEDKLLEESPAVVYVQKTIKLKQRKKTKKANEDGEKERKEGENKEIQNDKILQTPDFLKKNTTLKQNNCGKSNKPVESSENVTRVLCSKEVINSPSLIDDELLKNPAVSPLQSPTLKANTKVEKIEKSVESNVSNEHFTAVRTLEKIGTIPSMTDDKLLKKPPTVNFGKNSSAHKQKIKSEKNKEFVEDAETWKNFTAVRSPGKTTKISSGTGHKFLKKSTELSVTKSRTPKEKIMCVNTKIPPLKRKLTEETCDKKLSPVRKLSRKSGDNSASIFNTPLNNNNPVGVNRPLDDRWMVGQKFVVPSLVPVLDMSRANPIVRRKNIRATSKKIGFIGLGMMGQRIVKNLLESGHDVSIWNRTHEKCKQFVEAGAHQFLTPCDVALHCDIIFCCLSGPEATKSVVFGNRGILQGFQKRKPGTKGFVVLSSLDLKTAEEIASAVTFEGGNYLEAPISGSISNAEEGSLLLTVSGNHELFNDCWSCFRAISRIAYYFSDDVGSASIMHLCTSMVKGITTAALAEGMALAESMNFSRNKFQECVELSAMNCPLLREKGWAMVTNNFTTNHSLKYQRNDLRMVLKTSEAYSQPMPLASAANEVYKKAERRQYSNHDMSAVYFAAKTY